MTDMPPDPFDEPQMPAFETLPDELKHWMLELSRARQDCFAVDAQSSFRAMLRALETIPEDRLRVMVARITMAGKQATMSSESFHAWMTGA